MIRTILVAWIVSAVTMVAGLYAYHTRWSQPPLTIGVVDIADVYRAKERAYTEILTRANVTDEDRKRAMAMAGDFANALPKALSEMPAECQCLVLLKSAVVGDTPNTLDLTAALRRKLGMG